LSNLKEIKERLERLKEPIETYDDQGRLIMEYHPYSPYGEFTIEVVY
jgi:hypothetical protein